MSSRRQLWRCPGVTIALALGLSASASTCTVNADPAPTPDHQSFSQPASSPPLDDEWRPLEHRVRVAGGIAPLRSVLGLGPTEPEIAALDVIRILHGTPPDSTDDTKARWRRAHAYFATIETLEAAGTAGVSLRMATAGAGDRLRLQHVLDALGWRLAEAGGSRVVAATEAGDAAMIRDLLAARGFDAPGLLSALNAGGDVRPELPAELLPLPFSPDLWRTLVFRGTVDEARLGLAILRDRAASLLYYGAFALDAPTRAALEQSPPLLASLLEGDRAAAFAVFGRSVRIREGRVEPPGGHDAVPLWEELAGERVTSVAAFVSSLLSKDEGRLAYFYDAVAHLDRARQRYALVSWQTDLDERRDAFKTLYRQFRESDPTWVVAARPFSRALTDPALALMLLPLTGEGQPPPGRWRNLWAAALSDWGLPEKDGNAVRRATRPSEARPVDAGWLLGEIGAARSVTSRHRLNAVLFSWRVFGSAPATAAADVFTAVRAYLMFPALMLTIERMGIRDAAVYTTVARTAEVLTYKLPPAATRPALAQFQGAVGLLDRACFARTIDPRAASTLLLSLARRPRDGDGWYGGEVLRWLRYEFFMAAVRRVPDSSDAEHALLRALSGASDAAGPVFEWDGERFRVDVAGAELDRLARAREGQVPLGAVFAFYEAAHALDRGDPGQLPPLLERLETAASRLGPVVPSVLLGAIEDPVQVVKDVVEDLGRVRRPGDLLKVPVAARRLLRASDVLLADTLAAMLYATSAGEADSRLALGDARARFHDLAPPVASDKVVISGPWWLPDEMAVAGRPMHVRGSLLALDLALARRGLPRFTDAPPPHPPTLGGGDQRTIALTVALCNARELTDRARDEIAAALERGRARLNSMAAGEDDVAQALIEEAGVSEWRLQAMMLAFEHRPDEAAVFLSAAELLRLGRPDPAVDLSAWGTSATTFFGKLCLSQPPATAWENLAGRAASGLLATHLVDLPLFVAEHLAAMDVPALVGRAVLAYLAAEFAENVMLGDEDDWMSAVGQARALTRERVEEALTLLGSARLLVPVEGKEGSRPRA